MNPAVLEAARSIDGSLVAVFVDAAGNVVLPVDISEGMRNVDELFLRHLLMLASDVGVPGVIYVIRRASGRPARVDRLLWRELSRRLAGSTTALVDVIVVGDQGWWSAASGRGYAPVNAA
jgi:hypothetical protein